MTDPLLSTMRTFSISTQRWLMLFLKMKQFRNWRRDGNERAARLQVLRRRPSSKKSNSCHLL